MSGKLTKAQRETLECCADWAAPFEVAERRRARGSNVFGRRVEGMLRMLEHRELVRYHQGNGTYRITDLGRASLKQGEPM